MRGFSHRLEHFHAFSTFQADGAMEGAQGVSVSLPLSILTHVARYKSFFFKDFDTLSKSRETILTSKMLHKKICLTPVPEHLPASPSGRSSTSYVHSRRPPWRNQGRLHLKGFIALFVCTNKGRSYDIYGSVVYHGFET